MRNLKRFFAIIIALSMIGSAIPALASPTGYTEDKSISGWIIKSNYSDSGGYIDGSEGMRGTGSLKLYNKTPRVSQEYLTAEVYVDVEAGRTYRLEFEAKTENAQRVTQRFNSLPRLDLIPFSNTYDWTPFSRIYKPGADGKTTIQFAIDDKTDALWLDNVRFYDTENPDVNLIPNSDFESSKISENTDSAAGDNAEADGLAATRRTITVDGNLKDWEGISSVVIGRKQPIYDVAANEISGNIRVAADDKNLYGAVSVADGTHVTAPEDEFWNGDSVQFAIAKHDAVGNNLSHFGIAYYDEENKIYTFNGDFQAHVNKTDRGIDYEFALPWSMTFGNSVPDMFKFCIIINNNDGAGRAYCMELTPGISQGKNASEYKKFTVWGQVGNMSYNIIAPEGIGYGMTDNIGVNIVNDGLAEESIQISSDALAFSKSIVVNNGESATLDIPVKADEEKVFDVDIKVVSNGEEYVANRKINIIMPPYTEQEYFEFIKRLEGYGEELKKLILKCDAQKIPTDYEVANHSIITKYIEIAEFFKARNDYNYFREFDKELTALYYETKANLESYLKGEKKAYSVPKYVTGDIKIDGTSIIAKADTAGKIEERPMFFIGYGLFEASREDMPFFSRVGFNTNQYAGLYMEYILRGMPVPGWGEYVSRGSNATFEVSNETSATGNNSMKICHPDEPEDNHFKRLSQPVKVKPNTTYEFGLKAKATNISRKGGCWFRFDMEAGYDRTDQYFTTNRRNIEESSEWKDYNFEYTTGSDETTLPFTIGIEAKVGSVYIDDIYVREKGKDDNLLFNGGFEDEIDYNSLSPIEKEAYDLGMIIDCTYLDALEEWLKQAEQYNIMIDGGSIAHDLSTYVFQAYPELSTPIEGNTTKFDIHNEIARKIASIFVRLIVERLSKYDSAKSICLMNEPAMRANKTNAYDEEWLNYLKEKYDTLDSLNETWGSSYESFEEINMTDIKDATPKYYEYIKFNESLNTEINSYLAEVVRSVDEDILIHSKEMQYLHDGYKAHLEVGANHEELCKIMDVNGCDAFSYYKRGGYPLSMKMAWYDFQTSLLDAPVWDTECHITTDAKTIQYDDVIPYFSSSDAWNGAVHGRGNTVLWVWEMVANRGLEGGAWANANVIYRPADMIKTSKVALDLNRLSYEVTAIQKSEPKVGLLYSHTATVYGKDSMKRMQEAYEQIIFSGQKVGFVTDSKPEDVHKYEVLVIPAATKNVPQTVISEIKSFIEKGGKVIIVGDDALIANEYNQPHDKLLIEYIHNNSYMTDGISDKLAEWGLSDVVLVDEATGERCETVEWAYAEYNGKMVVNILDYNNYNYEGIEERNVKILYKGKPVENMTELRSMEQMKDRITIKSFTPVLVEFDV